MDKKRYFGYGLIIIGLAVLLLKPLSNITGNVIGINNIKGIWASILGLLFVFSGLITAHGKKSYSTKRRAKTLSLDDKISSLYRPSKEVEGYKPFLIIDSNFLIKSFGKNREKRLAYVRDKMKHYNVIIPDALKEELWELKQIEDPLNFSRFKDYRDLRKEMLEVLKTTRKYRLGKEFVALKNDKSVPLNLRMIFNPIYSSFRRKHAQKIAGKTEKEQFALFQDYVKQHYVDVDKDADFLASAVYGKRGISHPVPSLIVSSDSHIAESLNILKKKFYDLKRKVLYIHPEREKIAA